MQYSSRVSAVRRERNSHDAANPRKASTRSSQPRPPTSSEWGHTVKHSVSSLRQSERALVTAGAAHNSKDKRPRWHIAAVCRSENTGFQSVHWAAAAGMGGLIGRHLRRRLECTARHGLRRGAGGSSGRPREITGPWQAQPRRLTGAALPNPSLKRSANGRPPGPVWRYAVHFRQPGPGALPLSPA